MINTSDTPETAPRLRRHFGAHAIACLVFSVATALGGIAFGALPVAAEGTSACGILALSSWRTNGGHLEISIGGCAYQVNSGADPYVITVSGPDGFFRTIYRGDGTAPTNNVVLEALAAGTYTITSSGVIEWIDSPVYGSGSSTIQITAPADASPAATPAPAPPIATIQAPAATPRAMQGPEVTGLAPQNGAQNVLRNVKIRIVFSMPVDGRIGMTDLTTGKCVASRTSVDVRTLTVIVTPRAPLAANHTYRLTVLRATSIESGLGLSGPVSIIFRTGSH